MNSTQEIKLEAFTPKEMKIEQKSQDKEDEVKRNIQMENQVGMTGNFKYIGTNLSGLIQKFTVK